ncbi:MAG: DUF4349 domain-containing protein [Rickettsiales bacterium]|jgi:hypothetical protein|nr:DUF4349 domain-containing protein [Rickettsiales bacterium]
MYLKIKEFSSPRIVLPVMIAVFVYFINCKYMKGNDIIPIRGEKKYVNIPERAVKISSARTTNIDVRNDSKDQKIVKKFGITIVVKNVEATKNDIETELQKFDGYISNFYSYEYSNYKALSVEIKISNKNVDEYVKFLKNNGYTKSENFSTMDYTKQYNDNENKLQNLRLRRDRLRNMMSSNTSRLADILAVERELNNVQMEIETLEKKNIKIQEDVDYSSVNLTIEPEITENRELKQWSFRKVTVNAVNALIAFYHNVIQYFVIFIVFIPVFLLFFVLYIILNKFYFYAKRQ